MNDAPTVIQVRLSFDQNSRGVGRDLARAGGSLQMKHHKKVRIVLISTTLYRKYITCSAKERGHKEGGGV